MAANRDFGQYIDDLIVRLADSQSGHVTQPINLATSHSLHFPNDPPSWAEAAGKHMEQLGYGAFWAMEGSPFFKIEGGGLRRAAEVRDSRRRRNVLERLQAVPRSDWIALLALLTSVVALFK